MAEFIDARKQLQPTHHSHHHHATQQQQQQQSQQNADKKDLFKNVPDLVEERKKDQDGSYQIANKYIKGAILGKGGFAQVYVSTSIANKEKYALKIVAKSSLTKPRARLKLQTEIKIHRALNHSNIVRFERFFEDNEYAYLVLELCGNNSMSDLLNQRKRITEMETKYYLHQLASSLQYLHRHLVIHRDLKLGNLFIDENMKLKVGDFGLAAKLTNEQERRMTVCGTPNYIAPELLEGKKGHSFEVDIWSTGVVMYTLLIGKPPYQSKDVKSTYKRILANSYSYPDNITVTAEAKNLISRMLELKPEARATLQEILDHPFLTLSQIPTGLPVSAMKESPSFHSKSTTLMHQATQQQQNYYGKDYDYVPSGKAFDSDYAPVKPLPKVFNNENDPNVINRLFPSNNNTVAAVTSAGAAPTPMDEVPMKQSTYNTIQPTTTTTVVSAFPVPTSAPAVSRAGTPAPILASTRLQTPNHTNEGLGQQQQQRTSKSSNSLTLTKIGTVEKIHKMLDKSYSSTTMMMTVSNNNITNSTSTSHPHYHHQSHATTTNSNLNNGLSRSNPIWVVRYIDYTSKYGLGFLFNNGSAGVYFNDSTKIVLSADGEYFQYVERRKESSLGSEHLCSKYYLENYPMELQKKVTLLKHFRNYLVEEEAKNPHSMNHEENTDLQALKTAFAKDYADKNPPSAATMLNNNNNNNNSELDEEPELPFLKKWVKTKHAILFRISNRTVQVIFYDRSEVLLSSEAQIITYVNKAGERSEHALNDIMLAGRVDIAKRLKYTKDIMHRLIQSQTK